MGDEMMGAVVHVAFLEELFELVPCFGHDREDGRVGGKAFNAYDEGTILREWLKVKIYASRHGRLDTICEVPHFRYRMRSNTEFGSTIIQCHHRAFVQTLSPSTSVSFGAGAGLAFSSSVRDFFMTISAAKSTAMWSWS